MKTLFQELRSDQNLFSAWRHVRRSALSSADNDRRGFAAEFEHQHQRHLKRIARQLREGSFAFDSVKGVLKDKRKRLKEGKDPRPIAISTLKDSVVQRAILQVLQPRKVKEVTGGQARFVREEDPRLGKLNLVSRSRYGVGGLIRPYGGVQPAIRLIMGAMATGARFYYQSDIKAFFTKIPTKEIVETVSFETDDADLALLVERALDVSLQNKEELLTYSRLFPSGGVGVAQGSSLSALAGNILLYDFDHELNSMGVTAVRYIDDLLIVARTENDLERSIEFSKARLASFNFSLYEPASGSQKASRGRCEDSFRFLGCTLQPSRCVPSKHSIDSIVADVTKTISVSKRGIKGLLLEGKTLDPSLARSAVLQALGRKIYGWQKSFSFCTDVQEFKRLDVMVVTKILDYENWIRARTKSLSSEQLMQILGVPSTEKLFLDGSGVSVSMGIDSDQQ